MNTIARAFANYFKAWNIHLPKEALTMRQPGVITAAGWHIQYLFGADEQGAYLDFYAAHRMTNDRHHRLYESGDIKDLPAYLEWIVYPANATEEQKRAAEHAFHAHNAQVSEELRRKGFQ